MKIFKKEYILLLILAILCIALYFLFLGHYKLIDVDEPRYAEAASEMLKSGNWLTPYFNYEVRFDKPVFIYWLIALSYIVFGVTEFAARFPSAIMATLLVFFTYFFGRQTVSKSFGFMSAIILASSLEFIVTARMSITDMTLSFFICATIFSGFLGAFSVKRQEEQKAEGFFEKYSDIIYWNLAYLFSGAAVLTKGPVGFILPAGIFGICFILTGCLKKNLRLKYIVPGSLIFLAVAVPWYYLIIKEHGMAFVNYFFLEHNLERFGGGKLGHEQPIYFYPAVIFLGTFPWMFYLISALVKHIKEIVNQVKTCKIFDISIFKDTDKNSQVILFSLVWFFAVLLFFSMSSAKMVSYVLPLFPACALLAGKIWDDYINNNQNEKIIRYSSWVTAGLCFLMSAGTIVTYIVLSHKTVDLDIGYNLLMIPALFFAGALFLILFIKKQQKIKALFSLALMMAGIIILAVTAVMPVVYKSAQADLIEYINIAKTYNSGNNELITCGLTKPSLIFYSHRRIPFIATEDTKLLSKYLNSKKPVFIVTKKKYLEDLSKRIKYNLISPGKKYSLISNIKNSSIAAETQPKER